MCGGKQQKQSAKRAVFDHARMLATTTVWWQMSPLTLVDTAMKAALHLSAPFPQLLTHTLHTL